MAPKYNNDINHPVQIGWLRHSHEIDKEREHDLTLRFGDIFMDLEEKERVSQIQELLKKVDLAKQMTDSARDLHERFSRTKLHLDAETPSSASGKKGQSRLDIYTSLAGRPAKIGRFIEWFTELAPEFFALPETYNGLDYSLHPNTNASTEHTSSIGLELGGMWQTGDWSGTGRIDDMANDVPRQVHALQPDADIEILEGTETHRGYSMQHLDAFGRQGYNPHFPYAFVRRRRQAANIVLPGRIPVQIKKESTALLLIDQMPRESRLALRGLYRSIDSLKANNTKNSEAAMIAGAEFERAIQFDREESRSIIPIGAHYYMVADRPEAV